jgi:hypothetical protein
MKYHLRHLLSLCWSATNKGVAKRLIRTQNEKGPSSQLLICDQYAPQGDEVMGHKKGEGIGFANPFALRCC